MMLIKEMWKEAGKYSNWYKALFNISSLLPSSPVQLPGQETGHKRRPEMVFISVINCTYPTCFISSATCLDKEGRSQDKSYMAAKSIGEEA
ncbi:conserved hypothetical protein [Ricinus communis]|uniref:Uncharacterized protein n=1 Tax=Ricinus communis TaxID=3988 RepID=B9RTU9_RICCO|nr:conserved hypothetical protein [Ricinus communis]